MIIKASVAETGTITADWTMAAAGRALLAEQWAIIREHQPALLANADETAVHETRKAIRRTLTLFKLFASTFEPALLRRHRRRLKKIMRRLGHCRDAAVFRANLQQFQIATAVSLECLLTYWDDVQQGYDQALLKYLHSPKRQKLLANYATFVESADRGVAQHKGSVAAEKLRYHLPVLIYQRLAAVRNYGDRLEGASDFERHRLRVRFKELRYTLQFFEPLFNEFGEDAPQPATQSAVPFILMTPQFQEHLGYLNDAHVALRLLDETPDCEEKAEVHRAYQQAEHAHLMDGLSPLWATFNTAEMRESLAVLLSPL